MEETIPSVVRLRLRDRLNVAKEVESTWPPFEGTIAEYAKVVITKLAIPNLNYYHIHYIIKELGLPTQKKPTATVLDRLASLEKKIAELEARLTVAGA